MKNSVNLIGRLGKDPEVTTFEGGNMKASFGLATTEKYKDKATNENKEITDWHNIVCWGKNAEIAGKYLKKGALIDIQGRLKTRSWEDQAGVKKYITEVLCDRFIMLGAKKDSEDTGANTPSPGVDYSSVAIPGMTPEQGEESDLPF